MKRLIIFAALALASPAIAQEAGTPIHDRSIASLSGSSQQLFPDVGPKGVVERYVCNPSTASSLAINLSGGAAALNTAGSVTLGPGGCWSGRVSNQINVIGTAGQGVTAGSR
jgi:hypothetical protein